MASTRRKFLRVLGGGGVILAAGTGAWVLTRTPKIAQVPWQQAGQVYKDPIRNALSYAILAPNPHNRQPWLVDLKSPTEAVLFCQLDRRLPETDPLNRQITIGLGCFLELLRMAAAQTGHRAEIEPFPDGSDATALDERPVATIKLVNDSNVQKDPLFSTIFNRHTDRSDFDVSRTVPENVKNLILKTAARPVRAAVVDEPGRVAALRDLSWRAWLIETETPAKHRESVDLMRIGKREIETQPDGISISGIFPEAAYKLGFISRASLGDPDSAAFAQARDFMKPAIDSATAYTILATEGNDRHHQIAAGRVYVRMQLAATLHGVSMHPLSQALQEYQEMAVPYKQIHEMLAKPGETLQMFARIGYGAGAPAAPRWPLETRIVDH